MSGLDFEKPVVELEKKIEELKHFIAEKKIDLSAEVRKLEEKLQTLRKDVYGNLSAWQRVQLARHPQRPYTLDYLGALMTDFLELHGDRSFADDKALIGGFAKFNGQSVLVLGHQKGRDTKENLRRNFGCAHPEGYRKALRLMELADRAALPIVVFIDTPGAYPGVDAEERGQALAIALNLREMTQLRVPIVATIIGEGGSGGALGIGVADSVLILQNAYYSVISPEGCAAILWKSGARAPDAASVLKLTAPDLLERGLIDEIVPEPLGGAHRDPAAAAQALREAIARHLKELSALSPAQLVKQRYEKYRRIGMVKKSD